MHELTALKRADPVDREAVARALAHPAFDELFDCLVAESLESSRVPIASRRRAHRPTLPRWRVLAAAAAAVVLLLGVLAGVGVFSGRRALSHPFTTAWKPARAFSHSTSGDAAPRHGTWRLVDALVTGTWQQNVYGPPPGWFSCSPTGACYVLAGRYASASASAPLSASLYVTTDDGSTWSTISLPPGWLPTTPLECSSEKWCAAGGTYDGQPVLAVTEDGGNSFTIDPLPTGVGRLRALSCPTTDVCAGLVSTSGTRTPPMDATLLVTDNGAKSFRDEPILAGDSMLSLSCTSGTDCTVVGSTDASMGSRAPVGVSAVTSDQGRTWRSGSLPAGLGVTAVLTTLSCPDTQHCFVAGTLPMRVDNPPLCSTRPRPTTLSPEQPTTLPDMTPKAMSISEMESKIVEAEGTKQTTPNLVTCPGNGITQFSEIAESSDGGITWTLEVPPTTVPRPYLSGVTCPTATECWAAGQESVPVKVGMGVDMGSPVLIGTTDGGSTWSKVVFDVPATAPNPTGQTYLSMGSVTCPTANTCLARGMAAQNAQYAPVYSLIAPSG